MEVLLHNHIAARRECRVLVAYDGGIKSLLALRVLSSVNETDQVAAVEETESMHFVYGGDCRSKPSHDSRREFETEIHPLRADMKEHIAGR